MRNIKLVARDGGKYEMVEGRRLKKQLCVRLEV
jgi:hypothetical protein